MSTPDTIAPDFLTAAHATIEQFETIEAKIARSIGKPALVTTEYGSYYPEYSDTEGWIDPHYRRIIKGFQLGIISRGQIGVTEDSWSIPSDGVVRWQTPRYADLGMFGDSTGYEANVPDRSVSWREGVATREYKEDGAIVIEPLTEASLYDRFRLGTFVHARKTERLQVHYDHDIGRTQLFVGSRAIRAVMSPQEKEDGVLKEVLSGKLDVACYTAELEARLAV